MKTVCKWHTYTFFFKWEVRSASEVTLHVHTCSETGTVKYQFRYCMQIWSKSCRKTSDIFENLWICLCCLLKSQHSQDKSLTSIIQKKLAGISRFFGYRPREFLLENCSFNYLKIAHSYTCNYLNV